MSDVVIRVEGVSKLYRLGEVGTGSLAHDVNRWWHKVRGKEDPYLKIGEVNDRTKPAKQSVAGGGSRVTGEEGPGAVAGSELLVTSANQSAASPTRNSPPVTRHSTEGACHQTPATAPQGGALATSYSTLVSPKAAPSDWVYALKDVSFEVKRGEVLGIIGRNGAGKSTLLKILSRVTTQSEGRIKVRGRIASLLEVGTGFHPELTGRENIFLNGAILGMRKAEIARKFDEIVEFSGCARYIDTPVKRYSSGMYVRLAFAVAAHLEPEILIVDEVLAVGDAEFQKKCLGKMKDVAGHGRTILFVSHNMASISHLCSRSILMSKGEIIMDCDTDLAIDGYYKRDLSNNQLNIKGETQKKFQINERAPIRLLETRIKSSEGTILNSEVPYEGPIKIEIDYEVIKNESDVYVTCCFTEQSGVDAWWQYDADSPIFNNRKPGKYRASISMPKGFLRAGRYYFRPAIVKLGGQPLDYHGDNGVAFDVLIGDTSSALASKGVKWPSSVRASVSWETINI